MEYLQNLLTIAWALRWVITFVVVLTLIAWLAVTVRERNFAEDERDQAEQQRDQLRARNAELRAERDALIRAIGGQPRRSARQAVIRGRVVS